MAANFKALIVWLCTINNFYLIVLRKVSILVILVLVMAFKNIVLHLLPDRHIQIIKATIQQSN